MDHEFHAFQARIEAILPTLATKADIEAVRADMLRLVHETHKWMLASVIGMFIGFGGLFMAVGNGPRLQWQSAPLPAPVPAAQPAPASAPQAQQQAGRPPQLAFIIINQAQMPVK
ncbi:hypothetical protein [Pseudoduganella violacea]|uniref:Uncharacterized protein n=1 Tax=Pseudoduganella violacea TaxID=1715466 RepID=A0A7W5BAL1_9BURK|nr:hypothetical protein [Pseudoduganella violacea]MBB3118860.1 hypothetical protein [Pseudoduganella violacea]